MRLGVEKNWLQCCWWKEAYKEPGIRSVELGPPASELSWEPGWFGYCNPLEKVKKDISETPGLEASRPSRTLSGSGTDDWTPRGSKWLWFQIHPGRLTWNRAWHGPDWKAIFLCNPVSLGLYVNFPDVYVFSLLDVSTSCLVYLGVDIP